MLTTDPKYENGFAPMKSDVWITFLSVCNWTDAELWNEFLKQLESLMEDKIVKLDDKDPVRRKADTSNNEGGFVINFGAKEDSRWIRGKFSRSKVEFEIQIYKAGVDSFGKTRENSFDLFVPHAMSFKPDAEKLIAVFRYAAERLGAFYAYADLKDGICSKKPCTPSLDISRELLGVFWLTYFGPSYCDFFMRKILLNQSEATYGPLQGMTLQLAETPGQITIERRSAIEASLGKHSFAGSGVEKLPGQYALTLENLSSDPLGKKASSPL